MITRRTFTASLLATVPAVGLMGTKGLAQGLRDITFVQPSPSAINSFPVFVAIGEGYFAEEGLNVRVEAINGSGAVLQALSAGQAQFGRPGPGPVIAARSRGVDAVFIYNVAARSNFGIVVQQDSDIQGPEGLRGKVIGTGTADGAEVGFARNVMSGAGMTEGTDYTFLTVGDGGPATAAFLNGEIDAYSASTADAAILTQRGMPVRDITPPEYARFFGNGIATMGDIIRNDPDLVERFGRAFMRGHAFALDDANRETVLAHLAAGNPQEGEDREFQSALFDAVRSKTIPTDMSNGLGYMPPEVWAEWQDSLLAGGEIPAPLEDLNAAFTNDFIAGWNEAIGG
ncbi:ABC transporter substrate-binding protein [Roseibacterium sp. SDUM158016]|jgi:NitT/TauT family transport system substrate-binding protein|uniref:ABC transporter substrate-binding protein n=1 Tax=Roseicyclus sediminis TaxID=2980997 RepID=UPI0021D134DA|nr:ABC transporter substrate-binding protein [Roseibacterium sp. SDUM158016]MCU4651564.1 ABC transporter substrate-binding protein [Roseibacterium sp. SDUM158016]